MGIVFKLLDYVGSSMLVILIVFVLVDICTRKYLRVTGLVGRIIILVLLFLALLRT